MDPLIWTTKCPLANEISLYAEDWNHAIEHPEIIGKEELVKKIVEKPLYIQEGKTPFTAAYVFPPYNELEEGARVIVKFSTEVWPSGNDTGLVQTAYPIDSKSYPNPRLGKIVWTKKGGLQ
jgi:hypothetical protein